MAREDRAEGLWLSRVLGLVAVWLPFAVAVSRAASSAQWRDDLPAVRDLGLVAVGIGGGVSTLVTQALALVPLGSRTFRAALGSAVALALAAHLLYRLSLRVLALALGVARTPEQEAPVGRLGAALAAIATLMTALSPTWQREATVGGGAMIGVAVVLACAHLILSLPRAENTTRRALGLAALFGAALAECPPAALAIACFGVTFVVADRADRERSPGAARARTPSPRVLVAAGVSFVVTAALLSAPLALRSLAPRGLPDLGRTLSGVALSALDVSGPRSTALAAWVREVGYASLGIAAFGAAVGFRGSRTRPAVLAMAALVALDSRLPARATTSLSFDPNVALRATALAAIALASALGVFEVVRRLLAARFPMARATAVLVVVFHLTLVALTSEEAGFATDRSEQLAAETWTDEALGTLPPRSAILVRSPAIAWRLWAARLTRGERPDALVIPVPLLDRGRVAMSLAAAEVAVEPLLRDFAVTGEPSEFALSQLADVRPLHVEMDPTWSKRLVSHMRPGGLWLEFSPEPLGPSDRRKSTALAATPVKRVESAIGAATLPESSTASILALTLRTDANVLTALGDREAADLMLGRLRDLATKDPSVDDLRLPYALKGMRRAVLTKAGAERRAAGK